VDLGRVARHTEWLEWLAGDQTTPEPPPGFKDCRACEVRRQFADNLQGRIDLCRACPYEDAAKADGEELPVSPGFWFFYIRELACYPPEVIAHEGRDIGRRALRDLYSYTTWRDERREMMKFRMMQGSAIQRVFAPGEGRV
jgi:hypothetical protein